MNWVRGVKSNARAHSKNAVHDQALLHNRHPWKPGGRQLTSHLPSASQQRAGPLELRAQHTGEGAQGPLFPSVRIRHWNAVTHCTAALWSRMGHLWHGGRAVYWLATLKMVYVSMFWDAYTVTKPPGDVLLRTHPFCEAVQDCHQCCLLQVKITMPC